MEKADYNPNLEKEHNRSYMQRHCLTLEIIWLERTEFIKMNQDYKPKPVAFITLQ